MKVLVLSNNKNSDFVARLSEYSDLFKILNLEELKQLGSELNQFKHLYLRQTGLDYKDDDLEFLTTTNLNVFNSIESHKLFRSKKTQDSFFKKFKIDHIPLLSSEDLKGSSNDYVLKTTRGMGGRGVYIGNYSFIKNKIEEFEKKNDHNFLLQEFIKSDYELRDFFIGSKHYYFKKTSTKNMYNLAQSNWELVDDNQVSPFLKDTFKTIQNNTPLFIGAIDYLVCSNQIKILEINLSPGIKAFDKYKEINIIQEFTNTLPS